MFMPAPAPGFPKQTPFTVLKPTYVVTLLVPPAGYNTTNGFALNSSGQAVAQALNYVESLDQFDPGPLLIYQGPGYEPGKAQVIPDTIATLAFAAINNAGQLVASTGQQFPPPQVYENGSWIPIKSTDPGHAVTINNSGQVAGYTYSATDSSGPQTLFICDPGNQDPHFYGEAAALPYDMGVVALNDAGQLLLTNGYTSLAVDVAKFQIGHPAPVSIPFPGAAISNNGLVVGLPKTSNPDDQNSFSVFDTGSGTTVAQASPLDALGTFGGVGLNQVAGINNQCQVVGWFVDGDDEGTAEVAFIWDLTAGPAQLDDLIGGGWSPEGASWVESGNYVTNAWGINDAGQIVADVSIGPNDYAALLTPVNSSSGSAQLPFLTPEALQPAELDLLTGFELRRSAASISDGASRAALMGVARDLISRSARRVAASAGRPRVNSPRTSPGSRRRQAKRTTGRRN